MHSIQVNVDFLTENHLLCELLNDSIFILFYVHQVRIFYDTKSGNESLILLLCYVHVLYRASSSFHWGKETGHACSSYFILFLTLDEAADQRLSIFYSHPISMD